MPNTRVHPRWLCNGQTDAVVVRLQHGPAFPTVIGFVVDGNSLGQGYHDHLVIISTHRKSTLHVQTFDAWSTVTKMHLSPPHPPVTVSKLCFLQIDAPPIGHLTYDIIVDFWLLPQSSHHEHLEISPDPPNHHLTMIGLDDSGHPMMSVGHDTILGINEHSLRYTLEASPADCGAPLLDSAWRVVAIHVGVDTSRGDAWGLRIVPLLLHARRKLVTTLPQGDIGHDK